MARGFIPTEFDCIPSTNAEHVAKATVRQAIFLNFDMSLFWHSGLKIVWEISHKLETRNLSQRKIPVSKSPPPPGECVQNIVPNGHLVQVHGRWQINKFLPRHCLLWNNYNPLLNRNPSF